jgi:hypothetical protein
VAEATQGISGSGRYLCLKTMMRNNNIGVLITLLLVFAVSMPVLGLYNKVGLSFGIPRILVVFLILWLAVIAFGMYFSKTRKE